MQLSYEYIRFQQIESPTKTKAFQCFNIRNGYCLGSVRWYGSWRQYAFSPASDTVFSRGCLGDIQHFIKQLMDERKGKGNG